MTPTSEQTLLSRYRSFGAIGKPILPSAKVFVPLFQKGAPRERVLLDNLQFLCHSTQECEDGFGDFYEKRGGIDRREEAC